MEIWFYLDKQLNPVVYPNKIPIPQIWFLALTCFEIKLFLLSELFCELRSVDLPEPVSLYVPVLTHVLAPWHADRPPLAPAATPLTEQSAHTANVTSPQFAVEKDTEKQRSKGDGKKHFFHWRLWVFSVFWGPLLKQANKTTLSSSLEPACRVQWKVLSL